MGRLTRGTGCVVALALLLGAVPLAAQSTAPPPALPGAEDEPLDLIERGARLLFRGLWSELGPEFDAMGLTAPALGDVARLIDDVQHYEVPERLENGDILIRRRPDAPAPPPLVEGLERFWPFGDDDPAAAPSVPRIPPITTPPAAPQIEL